MVDIGEGVEMNDTIVLHPESGTPGSTGFNSVVHAARSGAADAREAAAKFFPVASQFLRTCAYGTAYGISYGVVFPSYLVAKTIPRDNPFFHGFIDGTAAAMDLARETRAGNPKNPALSAP